MHISVHECAVACWVHVCEHYELHVCVSHICGPPKTTSWVCVWSRPGFMHSGTMLPCPSSAVSTCLQEPTDSKFYPPPRSEDSRLALSFSIVSVPGMLTEESQTIHCPTPHLFVPGPCPSLNATIPLTSLATCQVNK